MRKLLLSLILSGTAWAQSPFQIQFVTTDPTGTCIVPSYPGYITLNRVTGNLKGCVNGSWASIGGGGSGNVAGPGSSTVGNIPTWSNTLGTQIGTGLGLVGVVGNPGSSTNVASEAAIRNAITSAGIGCQSGSTGTISCTGPLIDVTSGIFVPNPNTTGTTPGFVYASSPSGSASLAINRYITGQSNNGQQVILLGPISPTGITLKENCTPTSWSVLGTPAGSAQFDVWLANGSIPTVTNSITAGNYITLSAATFNTQNVTGWTNVSWHTNDVIIISALNATVTGATVEIICSVAP